MGDKYFRLENLQEVKQFESELNKYYNLETKFSNMPYFNLEKWFEYCQENQSDGKLFTMIFDIKLNLVYLDVDYSKVQRIFYERLNDSPDSIALTAENDLLKSIVLLHKLSDYVIRYRALNDKLMGLMVMLFASNEYNKYRRAKSRKKTFKSIFENYNLPLNIIVNKVFEYLENFDKEYRTPEIHSTGSLRKSVLLSAKKGYEEIQKLKHESWHNLIYLISEIDNFVIKQGK